jgi:hypothetical protein
MTFDSAPVQQDTHVDTGMTFDSAPVSQAVNVAPSSLATNTINPATGQGYGLYKMTDPTGRVVSIPYNNVTTAAKSGYGFASDQDKWQYAKDNQADPKGATYGASYTPAANEQTPEGHRAAVYAREDAASPLGQIAIGYGKGGGSITKPIGDLASVVGEAAGLPQDNDTTDYTQARGALQTLGKGAAVASVVAPSLIAAPVATAAGMAGGAVGNVVGKKVGEHLGLTDKQSDLLGDLFAIAGGAGGGASGEAIQPKVSGLLGVGGSASAGAEGGETAAAVSPEETKIQSAVAKSGLPEGTPVPRPEEVQAGLQQGIRQSAQKAAADAGVDYREPTTIRDAVGTVGRGVTQSAQADFQALDEASGGRWQRFDDQIKNIANKMDEVNGINDEEYSNLEYKRNEIETLQAQMVEDMKAAGKVDPAIADRAQAQYRRGMALQDVNSAVKAATKRVPLNGVVQEAVDPAGLSLRLSKLNDVPLRGGNSRLVQALGQDGAKQLMSQVDNAQVAAAAKPTGQDALADLLRRNTGTGRIEAMKQSFGFDPKVSHLKSFIEFNKMTQEQQAAFGDVGKTQAFLKSGARKELGAMAAKGVGLYAISKALGIHLPFLHSVVE